MSMLRYACYMDNNTDYFGLGLLLGQLTIHCEQVKTGIKLAAQIGCSLSDLDLVLTTAKQEDCKFIVVKNQEFNRASVWLYQKKIAEILIEELEKETAPSASDIVIAGKLFGYSDHAIEEYIMKQFSSQQVKEVFESAPNSPHDWGIDGLRKVPERSSC